MALDLYARWSLSSRPVRIIQRQLRRLDVDVSRWSGSYEARRVRHLRDLGVTHLVDVGANEGQYGLEVRAEGYAGRLLSIEPQEEAYRRLARTSAGDPGWDCLQCGLGAEEGEATLKLSANSVSSSLLPILDAHVEAEPGSSYSGEARIAFAQARLCRV